MAIVDGVLDPSDGVWNAPPAPTPAPAPAPAPTTPPAATTTATPTPAPTTTEAIPPRPSFFSPMSPDEAAQVAAWDAKYGAGGGTPAPAPATSGGWAAGLPPGTWTPTGVQPAAGTPGVQPATGIVNAAAGGMAPMPPAPPADNVQPVMGAVTPLQTVQGQLGDILKAGNPLIEAAKARAMQAANARGMQNTSMAAQAGEEAMVAAALPIAQQDAAVWQKQALVNQDITNQFLSMEKGKNIDLIKAYEAFQQNNYRFDKDEALKRYINDTGNSTQLRVAAMQEAAAAASLNTRLQEAGLNNAAALARQESSQDFTTAQNLIQLKSNNFTNYTNQLNQITTTEAEPDDKIRKVEILNQQYAGAPMPAGWTPAILSFPPK